MRVPTALSAAALAASAALLLTACGGGGDSKDSGKITGAQTGAPSASPSTSATAVPPDLTLPADLKLDFDWPAPSDPAQNAALGNAANFIRGIMHGVVKRNADDPPYQTYSFLDAQQYGRGQIQQSLDGGWTLTGTARYYKSQVRATDDGKTVLVSFCRDQTKMYGKDLKTGKVLYTKQSDKSFSFYEIIMVKTPATPGVWAAKSIQVQGKATQCKH